jgi:N-sulfoglucosamine sulfohydrolase
MKCFPCLNSLLNHNKLCLRMNSFVNVSLYKRPNLFFKLKLLVVVAVMFEICSFSCLHSQDLYQDQRPNILFAISDDASFPHKSAYGSEWVQTPAFDRVASEGILFNRAYVPNPKCAPSRSIILTGRNSWQLEEAANHWPYFPA